MIRRPQFKLRFIIFVSKQMLNRANGLVSCRLDLQRILTIFLKAYRLWFSLFRLMEWHSSTQPFNVFFLLNSYMYNINRMCMKLFQTSFKRRVYYYYYFSGLYCHTLCEHCTARTSNKLKQIDEERQKRKLHSLKYCSESFCNMIVYNL